MAGRSWFLLLSAAFVASMRLLSAQSAVDAAFKQFWDARSPQEAATEGSAVVKSGVAFDDAFARLKKGRAYGADAPRGVVRLSHRTAAAQFQYTLDVPQTYDPARTYQVRVQLHGGVGRPDATPRGNGSIGALAGAEQIYVLPTAWADAPWWDESQVDNLRVILDGVKRTYNIDENRVVMSGVSDGGTGAYYFAMRDTTPFASFLSLNGYMMVLANTSLVREPLFPHNLLNKPFFVVNGGRDPLYPTSIIEPVIRHLQRDGVAIDYHPQPTGVHNTAWWPDVKETFEAFVRRHPRDPLPSKVTWEAEEGASANRAHWLVIDKVVAPRAQTPPSDANEFSRLAKAGRVDLVREGNTVRATTRGVAEFTLLASPDAFNFAQPITVVADGRTVFNRRADASVATLMKWAALDNDRTMLFGAEIHVRLR